MPPRQLISPKLWPSRRPDGQTANSESDPVPPVKGSSKRPGIERIEARVPTQIGLKFKLLCQLNQVEQKDVLRNLVEQWIDAMTGRPELGRPDGQTALINDLDDQMISDDFRKNDDDERFIPPSSDQLIGRPDGQAVENPVDNVDAKRRHCLAYYHKLTGNPNKITDHDLMEPLLRFPTWAIKAGIAISWIRCKKPRINSLKYCYPAIEEMNEEGSESYLGYLESVLLREGKWNHTITPVNPQLMQLRQPDLPGTSGELVDLDTHRPKETQ